MAEFKKRENNNKLLYSPLVIVAFCIIIVIFLYNMIGLIQKERDTAKKKILVLNEISALEKREQDLLSHIDKLKTEAGTEDAIREKYQVVKEGEKMLVIVDEDEKVASNNTADSKYGFWNFLKNLFKK